MELSLPDSYRVDESLSRRIQKLGDKAPGFLKKVFEAEERDTREFVEEILHDYRKGSLNLDRSLDKLVSDLRQDTQIKYNRSDAVKLAFRLTSEVAQDEWEDAKRLEMSSDREKMAEAQRKFKTVSDLADVAQLIRKNYDLGDFSEEYLNHLCLVFENPDAIDFSDNPGEEMREELKRDSEHLQHLIEENEKYRRHAEELRKKIGHRIERN